MSWWCYTTFNKKQAANNEIKSAYNELTNEDRKKTRSRINHLNTDDQIQSIKDKANLLNENKNGNSDKLIPYNI